jgi:3-phosphoshikimate 1-carboxyvinyltransferase
MSDWKIRRAPTIHSELEVPGDKSISHRAVMLAALSNGVCVVKGFLPSEDCLCTVAAMRALGVEIENADETTLIIHGKRRVFTAPQHDIDCGNSGTTMRLLAGLLSGQPFRSRLTGDPSLSKRPMRRVMEPLARMGAKITAEGKDGRPPLLIDGSELKPIEYVSPVASAQVKSAILLAGMFARGKTSVTEPIQSRDHTERMLEYFLVRPQKHELTVALHGGQTTESRDFQIPGDISSAAFWLVAAAAQPRSHLLVKNVGLNETRTGVLAVLLRMGAQVREIVENEQAEPIGVIEVRGARLKATDIGGKEIPNVIDELPILAVAAALALGTTTISDAAELRVKETDRLAAIATNLRAMGGQVQETEDGLIITGGIPLHGARVDSFGDHRIAMAFAIAGLFAEGETIVTNTECVNTSYPGFFQALENIQKEPNGPQTPVITSLPN